MRNIHPKLKLLILLLIGFLLVSIVLGLILGGREDIDKAPMEGTSADYAVQVNMYDAEELFIQVEGDRQFNSITRDLFVFAKEQYKQYQKEDIVIGFRVISSGRSEDTVSFKGRYGSVRNTIEVKVKLLNNRRISTEIIDTKKDVTVSDERLPSNSKRNQFISRLPIIEENYDVNFSAGSETIIINMFVDDYDFGQELFINITTDIGTDGVSILFPPNRLLDTEPMAGDDTIPMITDSDGNEYIYEAF